MLLWLQSSLEFHLSYLHVLCPLATFTGIIIILLISVLFAAISLTIAADATSLTSLQQLDNHASTLAFVKRVLSPMGAKMPSLIPGRLKPAEIVVWDSTKTKWYPSAYVCFWYLKGWLCSRHFHTQLQHQHEHNAPYLRGGWILATQCRGHNRIDPMRISIRHIWLRLIYLLL